MGYSDIQKEKEEKYWKEVVKEFKELLNERFFKKAVLVEDKEAEEE